MLCLTFVHKGRVSHHFFTGGGDAIKLSMHPYAKAEQVLDGCVTVVDALEALKGEGVVNGYALPTLLTNCQRACETLSVGYTLL